MKKSTVKNLTVGSPMKLILNFLLPLLGGLLFQQLYNTADAWIVGHFRSNSEYAAVTSTGSLVFLLIGFFSGIAVGAGVVIARYYGALSIVMYNLGMGILRAVGDSKSPLYYLIFSSLVNIGLDYLFVGVFDWGVWSAALATSISQLLSAVLCIIRLAKGGEDYSFSFRRLRIEGPMLREVIRYGLPSGIQNSIIAFANVVVQSNINMFHEDTVAGCGTYSKLEGFAFLPITCYTMALTTFVSQNLGAKQHERAKKGSVFGIVSCVIMAELIGVVMLLFSRPLLSFFTKNEAAIDVGQRQIQVEALFFCMLSFSHCIAAIMRGAGKPLIPMFVMLGAWCVLRVAYISIVVPIVGESWVIFSAYPLTWTVSSVVFLIFYLKSDWIHGFDKKAAIEQQ